MYSRLQMCLRIHGKFKDDKIPEYKVLLQNGRKSFSIKFRFLGSVRKNI